MTRPVELRILMADAWNEVRYAAEEAAWELGRTMKPDHDAISARLKAALAAIDFNRTWHHIAQLDIPEVPARAGGKLLAPPQDEEVKE